VVPEIVTLMANSPDRPPDWRWRLAELLHADTLAPGNPGRADPLVRRAAAFLAGAADPALERAAAVRAEPPVDRGELEGRLLGGQLLCETAQAMGLSPDAVELYHELFFHVRDRLGERVWLKGVAAGPVPGPPGPSDVGTLVRLAGLRHGPAAAGAVAWYFRRGLDRADDPAAAPGLSADERAAAKAARAFIAFVTTRDAAEIRRAEAALRPGRRRPAAVPPGSLAAILLDAVAAGGGCRPPAPAA
jgi:hypothetical protein